MSVYYCAALFPYRTHPAVMFSDYETFRKDSISLL
jgi:hypothetical protein